MVLVFISARGTKVEIPRIRMGKSQEIETLINEEAYLLAMYLSNEKASWIPRIASFWRLAGVSMLFFYFNRVESVVAYAV